MKNKILYWSDPKTIEILRQSLNLKKVSLATSDTVLGLLAVADNDGFAGLNLIKNRCQKPYIVLVDSIEKVVSLTEDLNEKLIQFIKLSWPGPLTIIFKSKKNDNFYMKTFGNTIAIRIPSHEGLLKLLASFEGGLYSTSANLSGQPVPKVLKEVDQQIIDKVDCIVLDKVIKENILPSTILDCTGDTIKVIRQGIYPIDELEKFYGQPFIKGE